jgi:cation transport regulator
MPYSSNKNLPKSIQEHLPEHAQDIYREACNHAYETYKKPTKRREKESSLESVAHQVAWGAVKKSYKKKGEQWVPKKK